MAPIADVFWSAFDAAGALVAADEVRRSWFAESVLEGYTVGGVVAHMLTATERTATVLEAEALSDAVVVGLSDFYGPNRIESPADLTGGLHAFLQSDGASRASAGPELVVAAFLALRDRLHPLLAATPGDRLVPVVQVPGGAATLDVYLVTRVVELAVHTDDLACSLPGVAPPEPADDVVAVVTSAFVDLAVARSGGRSVIEAFARRERSDPEVLRVL